MHRMTLSHALSLCISKNASDTHWLGILTQDPCSQLALIYADQVHNTLLFQYCNFSGSHAAWRTIEKGTFGGPCKYGALPLACVYPRRPRPLHRPKKLNLHLRVLSFKRSTKHGSVRSYDGPSAFLLIITNTFTSKATKTLGMTSSRIHTNYDSPIRHDTTVSNHILQLRFVNVRRDSRVGKGSPSSTSGGCIGGRCLLHDKK